MFLQETLGDLETLVNDIANYHDIDHLNPDSAADLEQLCMTIEKVAQRLFVDFVRCRYVINIFYIYKSTNVYNSTCNTKYDYSLRQTSNSATLKYEGEIKHHLYILSRHHL